MVDASSYAPAGSGAVVAGLQSALSLSLASGLLETSPFDADTMHVVVPVLGENGS